MQQSFIARARSHSPELAEAAQRLEDEVWSHLGFLEFTEAHSRSYRDVLAQFADHQLCLLDAETEELVALANCVPARWTTDEALPAEGWDWLVEEGGRKASSGSKVLGALAISVPPRHRQNGLASRMIQEMKQLCERKGYETVVAPVRPSQKHRHPSVAMQDYVGWTDERGRCFDPWLRSHLQQGGRVAGVCARSMVVEQHLAFWETWAGREFPVSGSYAIEGGLVPVRIDLERRSGRYEEPNVWVAYRH